MSDSTGGGSGIWKDLQKVRVTRGRIEAPVRANGKDGIQIGTPVPKPRPAAPRDAPDGPGRPRRGLLARLLRR